MNYLRDFLTRLIDAGIVILERPEREFVVRRGSDNNPIETRIGIANEYVFYNNDNRYVLGTNVYLASLLINHYPQLYGLYRNRNSQDVAS